MNLADFLRQGPLTQQRMADASAFDRDSELANMMRQHGTVSQQPSALDRSGDIASNLFYGDTVPPKDKSILDPQYIPMKGAPQKYDGVGMDLVMPAITAFHGSPHKFTKFDMSKIGTGEGAQAYGHGIYAAENPNVAKNYAPRDFDYEESLMDAYKRHEQQGDYEAMEIYERAMMHETPAEIRASALDPESVLYGMQDTALRVADEIAEIPINSNLYKVDIPDDQIAKMLDWDKPLSEQSENIRKIFGANDSPALAEYYQYRDSLTNKYGTRRFQSQYTGAEKQQLEALRIPADEAFMKDHSGRDLYNEALNLSDYDQKYTGGQEAYYGLAQQQKVPGLRGKEAAASEYLRSQGIPGIKYLDGGSRSGGKGTSNFVLFSDEIAKILERNDQPIGELAEMLSSGKKVKP